MRCRSCNVLNMHALGKRVTQISMNARAVAGVNEVNCLGMLGCGMWGQLLIGLLVGLSQPYAHGSGQRFSLTFHQRLEGERFMPRSGSLHLWVHDSP